MLLFSYPIFFIAGISLPLLVVLYKLRNQPKSEIVSSLMLWDLEKQPDTGGRLLKKLPLPMTLFLELIVLALLVVAATTPLILSNNTPPPLVVILDDSYSMLAGKPVSARKRGELAIINELAETNGRSINIILAGKTVSTLGSQTTNGSLAISQLRNWHCRAAQSDISQAIGFVRKMFPKQTEILVISDKIITGKDISSGTKWVAVGEPLVNIALTNATRTAYGEHERYLFEISNMSDLDIKTTLSLQFENSNSKPRIRPVAIDASETRKIIMELPTSLRALTATIGGDQLDIDNSVTLMPQSNRIVKVKLNIQNEAILKIVQRALKLSHAEIVTENPEFIITDSVSTAPKELSSTWVFVINNIKEAKAFTGPFILDKTNPINEGVFLNDIIWGASDSRLLSGTPIISAANVPLLTETIYSNNSRIYQLQMALELSTLKDSSGWPILIWNLVEQRRKHLPGPSRNNYRIGEQSKISLELKTNKITVTQPDGVELDLNSHSNEVALNLDETGIWTIATTKKSYSICVNTLLYDESNLKDAITKTVDKWEKATSTNDEFRSCSWLFLIIALVVFTTHLYLIRRRIK